MSMTGDLVETGIVTPTVSLMAGPAGAPLNPMAKSKLVRTVIDTSVHRPDMFELTFVQQPDEPDVLSLSMIDFGTEIKIEVDDSPGSKPLIVGEVTSIEGDYDHLVHYVVIRGYEHAHRLQRARRSRTFLDSTDGDIVRRVAEEAEIDVGDVQDPGVTHRYIAQVAQTDWEFLQGRAHEIGFEVGVLEGELFFRPAPGVSAGGLGAAAAAAGSMLGLGTTLTFGNNLRWLRPRISSAGLAPKAEVRVWDPDGKAVVSSAVDLASGTADVDADPAQLASAFGGMFPSLPVPQIPGVPSFLGADPNAFAVVDRPLGWGSVAQSAADAMAAGMAEHAASTFAEAEGLAQSEPGVVAGATVTIENVPDPFAGDWHVTSAQHVLDASEGYDIRFEVSGRHDRSLHGLMHGGHVDRRKRGLIDGLVPGIVTNNVDDDGMHRVKVSLPWLSGDFETDWARVAMPGLGVGYGLVAIPEVGDEVLVGFEFGDPRRAYVIGGLVNGETEIELGGDAVKQGVPGAMVVKRGWISRLGHKVLIDDDGDGLTLPITSGITIGNADDTISIHFDDVNKKLTIMCDAMTPSPAAIEIKQNGAGGSISIEQAGTGGSISITSAGNVSVEASAPGQLALKGGAGVSIDGGAGMVEVKGSMVKLG